MADLLLLWLMLPLATAILLPHDDYNLGSELDVSELGSLGQTVFALVRTESTWTDAELACRDQYSHGAGTLARPDSYPRHQTIRALMKENGITKVWIGLRVHEQETLRWADWRCSKFNESEFNRISDEPADYRVKVCFMLEEDVWVVDLCSRRNFFVCQYQDLRADVVGCTNKDGGSLFHPVGISFYAAPFSTTDTWGGNWGGTSNSHWWNANAGYPDGDNGGQTVEVNNNKCRIRCASTWRCVLAVEAKESCLLGVASMEKKTFVRRQCYRGELSSSTSTGGGGGGGGGNRNRRAAPDYTCLPVKVSSLLSEYRSAVDQFTSLESINVATRPAVSTVTTTRITTETVSYTTTWTTSILVTQTVTTTVTSHPGTHDSTVPMTSTQNPYNGTRMRETSLSPSFNPTVTQTDESSQSVANSTVLTWQYVDGVVSGSADRNSVLSNSHSNIAGSATTNIETSFPSATVTSSVLLTQTPHPCSIHNTAVLNLTKEELRQIQKAIVSDLLVNKRVLSSTRRKKESSSDARTTATACGGLAITLLVLLLVTFVLLDIKTLTDATRILTCIKRHY